MSKPALVVASQVHTHSLFLSLYYSTTTSSKKKPHSCGIKYTLWLLPLAVLTFISNPLFLSLCPCTSLDLHQICFPLFSLFLYFLQLSLSLSIIHPSPFSLLFFPFNFPFPLFLCLCPCTSLCLPPSPTLPLRWCFCKVEVSHPLSNLLNGAQSFYQWTHLRWITYPFILL